MFIMDYLYSTPAVYQKALERTQLLNCGQTSTSTLVYNKDSCYTTNFIYTEMLNYRYLSYKIMKFLISLFTGKV